ncbi:MAG: GNAT family N-acetyltransferase, partial [Pseudomonadota bacterium]
MSCAKHGDVHFTPVRLDQLDLLGTWLSAPHNQKWWGDPDVELSYIRDMVEGRDTTRPFLFHVGGEPVGYIQYWFVGHHQNETWTKDHPWLLELPSETIGIDLSIGEADRLSKGIGSRALWAFVDWLLARGYRSIIID